MDEYVRKDVYTAHRDADLRRLGEVEEFQKWAVRLIITSFLGIIVQAAVLVYMVAQ